MIRKHRSLIWILLFISVVLLLGTLATGWNMVLVTDYHRMLELAHETQVTQTPWTRIVLGTLGFVVALGSIVLFFVKLLQEMHLNQQQSEFLATVTHELKTPIAALELTSTLIKNGGLTEEEQNKLWNSHKLELKRLSEEVSTLLEAARWQSKGPQFSVHSVALETWLSEAMERWKRLLGPQARLERSGDSLKSTQIQTDPRALSLIADNILDNARKFSKSKEAPYVKIHTRLQSGRWQIEFIDDGWGFDPKDSRRIFERFVRTKTGAPEAVPGTGLGLYLARSASRSLGLSLKASSKGLGKGATFILEGRA